jgi:hypothetical protein
MRIDKDKLENNSLHLVDAATRAMQEMFSQLGLMSMHKGEI